MLSKVFSRNIIEAASLSRTRTLFPSYSSAKAFSEAFAASESIIALNTNLDLTSRNNFADSTKYYVRYVNLITKCEAIKKGFESLDNSFENFYNSYKQISKNYSSIEKSIKSKNYETLKWLNSNYSFIRRINNFDDSNFGDINSFKHPTLIDYYFQRKSLCSVKYGLLTLPLLSETENYINNVIINYIKSDNFVSEDTIENIKTLNTSYSTVYKSKFIKPLGCDLSFIFEFNKTRKTNLVKITDASIKQSSIKEIFYYKDSVKTNINFNRLKMNNETICFFNEEVKAKRIYITFNQINYIDYDKDTSLNKEEIIKNNSNSSYEVVKDQEAYYWYEINIDKVTFIQRSYKSLGMLKLQEIFESKELEEIYINIIGLSSLSEESIELYVEGHYESLKKVEGPFSPGEKINISKYNSFEIILILKSELIIKALDIRGI